MKKIDSIKDTFKLFLILLGMSAFLGGCGLFYQPSLLYHPTKPFPAPIPDNASISVNFNEHGKFFIADKDGEAILTESVPFSALLEETGAKDTERIKVLGSYTLYKIKGSNNIWICDKDFQCGVGSLEGKTNSAVFSVNYDGTRLFLGNDQGQTITVKDLRSFASLVQSTEFSEKVGLETLSVFNVYEIKGSVKIATCSANNICFCTCFDPDTRRTTACRRGRCPR